MHLLKRESIMESELGRIAILQGIADREHVQLPDDVALFIASHLSDERDLEGALIRLVANSSLVGRDITLPYEQKVLNNFINSPSARPRIKRLL